MIYGAGLFALLAASIAVPAAPAPDGSVASGTDAGPQAAVPATEPAPAPTATSYPTIAAALGEVLASQPRVLAIGEFHQTKATAEIASALKRFTNDMLLPLHAAGATDLVVETWLATGTCGEVEKKAVEKVEQTTERPARTENEVLTLLRKAKQAGMVSRILQVACKDYQAVMGGGEVDFERLLRLTRDQLETQIRTALRRRGSGIVLSYGGALHNDLAPLPDLAPYSFGPAIAKAVGGRYVELDLYVPEFVETNPNIRNQPWFPVYQRAYRRGRFTLVRLGKASFALVFPRTK
jgi:hypothetical protein